MDRAGLDAASSALERRGCILVGATVRDRAIVPGEIDFAAEPPIGCTDVREAVDEVSRELRARLVKPLVGRPAGGDAGPTSP